MMRHWKKLSFNWKPLSSIKLWNRWDRNVNSSSFMSFSSQIFLGPWSITGWLTLTSTFGSTFIPISNSYFIMWYKWFIDTWIWFSGVWAIFINILIDRFFRSECSISSSNFQIINFWTEYTATWWLFKTRLTWDIVNVTDAVIEWIRNLKNRRNFT